MVASTKDLTSISRVPEKFRRRVRLAKKETFIFPNGRSARVVQTGQHHKFLQRYGNFFSSSANLSGEKFSRDIAIELSDLICEDSNGFFESTPSSIYKIGRDKIIRVR